MMDWQVMPFSSSQKAKYSVILSMHCVVGTVFLWSAYTLISQCVSGTHFNMSYWIKIVFIVASVLAFIFFVLHQSKFYVRLFMRWSVHNKPVVHIYSQDDTTSKYSCRDDLALTSGVFEYTVSAVSIGAHDMQ